MTIGRTARVTCNSKTRDEASNNGPPYPKLRVLNVKSGPKPTERNSFCGGGVPRFCTLYMVRAAMEPSYNRASNNVGQIPGSRHQVTRQPLQISSKLEPAQAELTLFNCGQARPTRRCRPFRQVLVFVLILRA
jgi:hypothetical protein